MGMGLLVAVGAMAALLSVVVGLVLALVFSGRRRMQQALDASRADVEALRARLDEVERSRAAAAAPPDVPLADYQITTAGEPDRTVRDVSHVPPGVVLSATLGEPLVKAVAFAYGVRRALSPDTRNRIAFEVRREVKRARKQRRRAAKRATRRAASNQERSEVAA